MRPESSPGGTGSRKPSLGTWALSGRLWEPEQACGQGGRRPMGSGRDRGCGLQGGRLLGLTQRGGTGLLASCEDLLGPRLSGCGLGLVALAGRELVSLAVSSHPDPQLRLHLCMVGGGGLCAFVHSHLRRPGLENLLPPGCGSERRREG